MILDVVGKDVVVEEVNVYDFHTEPYYGEASQVLKQARSLFVGVQCSVEGVPNSMEQFSWDILAGVKFLIWKPQLEARAIA